MCFPASSVLVRATIDALLRHSQNKYHPPPRGGPPEARELADALATRLTHWHASLKRVSKQEARGEEVDEWDGHMAYGSGVREIVDRLGELPSVVAALRSGGLVALSAEQRVMVLHGLCEQVLVCLRSPR